MIMHNTKKYVVNLNRKNKMEIRQNWWQLTSIQLGGAICLPVIMVGQLLATKYGFLSAIIALLVGNGLLLLLGLAAAQMSLKKRVTTVENARDYFGARSSKLLASAMIICMLGWFAIQLNLMSLSLADTIQIIYGQNPLSSTVMTLILGTLITIVALKGIEALDRFATITMPLLIGTMGYALYNAYTAGNSKSIALLSDGQIGGLTLAGVPLVIATCIAVVADLPTYYRFAASRRDSFASIAFLFLLAVPVIEFVGVYMGSQIGGANIIETLTANGGSLWHLWIGLFLLFAGWTTNNTNLYSAAVCLKNILPKYSQALCTIAIGIAGTLLASVNLLQNFELVLEAMGIMIASMAAVILTRFVTQLSGPQDSGQNYKLNLICWAIGLAVGCLSLFGIVGITYSGLIDSWISASGATIAVMILRVSQKNNRTLGIQI